MTKISLELGSGGRLMREFIAGRIVPAFGDPLLGELGDAVHLPGGIAFTTDSYVVDPLFFPGGDIGRLAVNGTVNDLVVSGAKPRFLSLALILEEGLEADVLDRVIRSIRTAAKAAGVRIVTGDTKVVRRGQGDKIYINTAGVGLHGRAAAAGEDPPGRQDHPDRHARRPQPGRDARPRRFRLELERPERLRPASLPPAALEERAPCGCATSPGAGWRPSSSSWPSVSPIPFSSKKTASRCRGPSARRASSSGSIPSTWLAKGRRSSSPRRRKPASSSAGCAATRLGPQGRGHRRGPGPGRPARRAAAPDGRRRPPPPRAPDLRAPPPHLLRRGQT